MYFKILLASVLFYFSVAVSATEYVVMVPNQPGTVSDVVIRKIADIFNRNTGDNLVVENVVGSDGIVGTVAWKNNKVMDIYVTSASALIFAPLQHKNLTYNDNDFDQIIHITSQTGLWITRPDTVIKNPKDLLTRMPSLIGGYAAVWNQNAVSLAKEKNLNIEIVNYKGTNDVIRGILSKDIDLAVVAPSPVVLSLVKDGQLHIVGTTHKDDIKLDNLTLLSVPKYTGVPGFNGFIGIALKPQLAPAKSAYLKKELWKATNTPEVKSLVESVGFVFDPTNNNAQIVQSIVKFRDRVKKYSTVE
jgi:tripartite-type tricarboxylate transporter receptor subunit TctC